jgi:signal transduction histidine kinase
MATRPALFFTAAFVTVAAGFLGSTVYTEIESAQIDHELSDMDANSMPSVEHLAGARAALWRLELALEHYARAPEAERAATRRVVVAEREYFDREVQGEVATPDYPGEHEREVESLHEIAPFEGGIEQLLNGLAGADSLEDVHEAAERVDESLTRWMDVNALNGRGELARMKSLRRTSTRLAMLLDSMCVALSVVAGGMALVALRRQRQVEVEHERVLSERANELEMFAKRVAHDLLSPLASLSFVLSSVKRASANGQPVAELLFRADAVMARARRLVEGALDFARSGATVSNGRSRLREIVAGVVDEARGEDGATEVELVIEPFDDTELACAPGVLSSVLGNLVGNAVKYTAGRTPRRVTVRANTSGPRARVEVEDTGPGLPDGFERAVFEPYVRAPDALPGLGLGLATVRRFVEAHGGRVGVSSVKDHGCVFWFELPKGGAAGAAPELAG